MRSEKPILNENLGSSKDKSIAYPVVSRVSILQKIIKGTQCGLVGNLLALLALLRPDK